MGVGIKVAMSIMMITGMDTGGVEGEEEGEAEAGVRVGVEGEEVEVDDNDYVNLVEYLGLHATIDDHSSGRLISPV